mmetsp:Transcript_28935/g.84824  ORF Transcript_28935/g.84824 Transcript_28935/m.84824 type:complete len:184 (-) Transcript_28935:448-999(-)
MMAKSALALVLASLATASAFSAGPATHVRAGATTSAYVPAVSMDASAGVSRRVAIATAAGAVAAGTFNVQEVFAADYKLTKDYLTDAQNLIENMRLATNLTRGTPGFEDTVVKVRGEMNDFVSYYRRQTKYSGAQSFNTLYTAVNTLSGHYASFGNSYPVPAKRRDRLTVQYKEIEKYLKKGR